MADDRDIGDRIKELEKGLQGLSSEGSEEDLTGGIDDKIRALEAQLGPDSDQQNAPLPDVSEIMTLFAMDVYLKETAKVQTKEFYLKLLARKEKYLGLIADGKVTPDKYADMLEKKLADESVNPKIAKSIGQELEMLAECANKKKEWFELLAKKSQKSLLTQKKVFPETDNHIQTMKGEKTVKPELPRLEAVGNQQAQLTQAQSPRQPQQPVSMAPSATGDPANKQQALMQKLDMANPQKKAEIVLKSLAKVESLMIYYKQNMPERKAKEINDQLMPKRELALKVVQALLKGKEVPIGDFVLNKIPKVDFERFHGTNRKEFYANVEVILKKYKLLEKGERDFKKKIGRSAENNDTSNRTNQLLKQYEEDIEYLSSIRTKDFVPLPSVKVSAQERENFVENTKLQKNDLQITIVKVEGINCHAELKVYFEQSNNPRSVFEVNEGPCAIDFLLKVTEEALKEITRRVLRIKIEGKKMLVFSSTLAQVEIPLSEFANKNSVDGVAESQGVKISYQLNMRTPRNRVTKTKMETIVMRRYPEYVYDPSFETDFLKKFINYSTSVKAIEEPIQQSQQQVQNQPAVQQPQPGMAAQQKVALFYAERTDELFNRLKSIGIQGFTPDQIMRPEIYSDCLTYLTRMDEVLDKALNQSYAAKFNKQLIEEMQDEIMKKKGVLENTRKAGKLPNELYVNLLRGNIQRDQALLQVFGMQGFQQLSVFINARIQIAAQQINSLMVPQQAAQVVQQPTLQQPPQPQQQPVQQPPQSVAKQPSQPKQPEPEIQRTASTKPLEQPPVGAEKQNDQISGAKQYDLSAYPLIYAKRTAEISQALASITSPIDNVDPAKIRNPEGQCFSVKYLSEFEGVLDKAMNDFTCEKAARAFAEELQDSIMKNKMMMEKKKAVMTPEQYRTLVNNNIEQDQKLFEIYKKLNLVELQQFVLGRIRLMKVELGEAPVMTLIKNSFNLSEEREISDIQRTPESARRLQKLGVELQRPELPQFCSCLTYIEKMIEVSKSPDLVKELTAAKDRFEELAGKGEMDETKYAAVIRKNKEDDQSRLEAYRKLDLKEFYLFVKARLKLINEELANL